MDWGAKELSGIVVALIGATGVVVAALVNRRKNVPKVEEKVLEARPPIVVVERSLSRNRNDSERKREPVIALSHSEIREKLERATPFHRDALEKSYVGVRVRWRISFQSFGDHGAKSMVFGDVAGTKAAIECNGTKEDFLSLIHAAEGEEVEVEGTISLVSRAFTILDDCVAHRLVSPTDSF